jgi:hypothetical protein
MDHSQSSDDRASRAKQGTALVGWVGRKQSWYLIQLPIYLPTYPYPPTRRRIFPSPRSSCFLKPQLLGNPPVQTRRVPHLFARGRTIWRWRLGSGYEWDVCILMGGSKAFFMAYLSVAIRALTVSLFNNTFS